MRSRTRILRNECRKKSQKAKARSGIPMAYIPSTIRCSVYRRTQRAVLRLMKSEIKECETVM